MKLHGTLMKLPHHPWQIATIATILGEKATQQIGKGAVRRGYT